MAALFCLSCWLTYEVPITRNGTVQGRRDNLRRGEGSMCFSYVNDEI